MTRITEDTPPEKLSDARPRARGQAGAFEEAAAELVHATIADLAAHIRAREPECANPDVRAAGVFNRLLFRPGNMVLALTRPTIVRAIDRLADQGRIKVIAGKGDLGLLLVDGKKE